MNEIWNGSSASLMAQGGCCHCQFDSVSILVPCLVFLYYCTTYSYSLFWCPPNPPKKVARALFSSVSDAQRIKSGIRRNTPRNWHLLKLLYSRKSWHPVKRLWYWGKMRWTRSRNKILPIKKLPILLWSPVESHRVPVPVVVILSASMPRKR